MKTNDSAINGGTVCGVPGAGCKSGDWRQAYADYLVQYAKDYAAAGVPLSYVGPENETNDRACPRQHDHEPGADAPTSWRSSARRSRGPGLATRAECCASDRLGLRAAVRGRDRGRQASELGNGAVHQPRLFRSARLAAVRAGTSRSGRPSGRRSRPGRSTRPGTTARRCPGSPGRRTSTPGLTKANLGAFLYLWGANTSTTTITGPNDGTGRGQGQHRRHLRPAVGVRKLQPVHPPGRGAHRHDDERRGPRRERVPQQRRVDRRGRAEHDLAAARSRPSRCAGSAQRTSRRT